MTARPRSLASLTRYLVACPSRFMRGLPNPTISRCRHAGTGMHQWGQVSGCPSRPSCLTTKVALAFAIVTT
jgi:hypothetical protein